MDYDDDYPLAPQGNETLIYASSDAVMTDSPVFDFWYELACALLFWVMLAAHGGLGLYHYMKGEWRSLLRWPLYFMMLAYVVASWACENLAFIYTARAQAGHPSVFLYVVYILFWHASSALFLVLLLALSSGYCITRDEIRGLERVYIIPSVVFIAGVAADWTYVYVETSQNLSAAADRYDFAQMTPFESIVWMVGSLANIMCFILSWVVIFDSIQLEIKALDDEQQALLNGRSSSHTEQAGHGDSHTHAYATSGRRIDDDDDERPGARDDDAPVNPHATNGRGGGGAPLGRTSARQGLLYGMPRDSSDGGGANGRSSGGGTDEETGGHHKETFADHVQYTVRKTLLSRFYFGVCAYLLASIMVIMLPAFFNMQLMNAIVVLQFVVKYGFTAMLAWIFRPARDSPYLQIGLNDSDADDMGLAALDTELVVTDHEGASPAAAAAPTTPAQASQRLPVSTPPRADDATPPAGGSAAAVQVPLRHNKASFQALMQQDPAATEAQKKPFTLADEE